MFLGYIDPGSGVTITTLGGWALSFLIGIVTFLLVFFRKHKRLGVALLSGAALLALWIAGTAMNNKKPSFEKKIIILGLDGLDPGIMEEMMAHGELPHFRRLKDTGSYQRLGTTNPAQSPVAWAAFATGKNPGENGIFDFIVRDPRTYALSLSLSNIKDSKAASVLKAKPFWYFTSKAKIPAVIIGCPLTFPPDKLTGRMLSGMGVPDVLGTEGTFTFYTSEPLRENKDTGGNVFFVEKAPTMSLNLIGPRIGAFGLSAKNSLVPLEVSLESDQKSIVLTYLGHRCRLEAGHWSDWQEVEFIIDPIRKLKGIFKFYLVSVNPAFRLYISPIQLDPREPYYPISYPAGYAKELAEKLGLFHTAGMPVDTWAINEKRLSEKELLDQAEEVLGERKGIFDFELGRFEKGVLFCYFGTADTIQHMFWNEKDQKTIKTWYKKFDAILGDAMGKINKGDTLIVLSDHGFGPFRRAVHVNTWLRKNGYLVLKNPLALDGADLLKDVDWSKTKAYAVSFGAIYINQRGREGKGVVSPGQETERLKEEIAEKLKKWIDEKTNEPVIANVYKNEDIFQGPYAANAPDLYIGFNAGYRASWQTALGGAPNDLIEDNLKNWSGDHLFDPKLVPGILFTNNAAAKNASSMLDIAPVVLKIAHADRK